MTAPAHPLPAERSTAPSARVARHLGEELGWYGLIWLGVVIAAVVVGNLFSELFGAGIDRSVAWSALALPRYVLLVGGIVVATSHLPLHVGLGVTRRDFLAGALPALGGVAVVAGLVALGLLAIEGVVYDALDWPHDVPVRGGGGVAAVDLPTAAVSLPVIYVLHAVSGLIGAAGFMRGGWVLGALFVPVAAVPAAVGEVLIGGDGPGQILTDWAGFDPPSLPVVAAIGLVVALLGAGVVVRMLRAVPLDAGDVHWWR